MEPRPLGRGMIDARLNATSTPRLQWSHDLSVVECSSAGNSIGESWRCFNGATTSRSWNAYTLQVGPMYVSSLQWSHDLSVVECSSARGKRGKRPASMEPRPLGRGMIGGLPKAERPWLSFNGATTSRSWNESSRRRQGCRCRCFNGATTSRSWNVSSCRVSRPL